MVETRRSGAGAAFDASIPSPTGCPERPPSIEEIPFTRQTAVRWFAPEVLAGTLSKVFLSGIFGAYADKREIQAALAPSAGTHDYSASDDLWIDYVADLGDGFDATYSIAHLLARERLTVAAGDASIDTQRAKVLIMGGDQVYPSATRRTYEDRLVGPYRAALPCAREPDNPHLFAIPGNHDWYDGLTNFMRMFCTQSWIGGWRTQQERSYFALNLPHGWSLWGIDIQFDTYIDEPQLNYFRAAARKLEEGDRIILCTAKPGWIKAAHDEHSYRNMQHFEKEVLRKSRGRLALVISGDLHHYSRYRRTDGDLNLITSGGGGAYLYPTHHLEERLELGDGEKAVEYERGPTFPSTTRSRALSWGSLLLFLRNPSFGLLAGLVYLVVAQAIRAAITPPRTNFIDALTGASMLDLLLPQATARLPRLLVTITLMVVILIAVARSRSRVMKVGVGTLHGLAHTIGVALVMWGFSLTAGATGLTGFWLNGFFIGFMLAGGAIVGSTVFGLYLAICVCWLRFHANEAFSCQRIEGYKCFLRMRIGRDRQLTVWPIGIDDVCRKWELDPDAPPEAPWFTPIEPLSPRLIESSPLRIG